MEGWVEGEERRGEEGGREGGREGGEKGEKAQDYGTVPIQRINNRDIPDLLH